MNRFLAAGRLVLCLMLLVSGAALFAADPAPELLKYIKDARGLGFKDAEIKAHAVKAGWQESVVEEAFRALSSAAQKPSVPAAQAPAENAKPPRAAAPSHAQKPQSRQPAAQPPDRAPAPTAAASAAQQPAPDLLQYVKDARGLGLPDSEIAANAIQAGWPRGMVEQAVHPQAAAVPGTTPTSGAGAAAVHQSGVPDDYQIGAGDVLDIRVWKEPDASVSAVVRPDGKITVPLLKEISVVGLTPTEVERIVSTRLGEFIRGANVTVVVSGINSKKIFLVGAVKKEGPVPLNYRMSVLQALSEAGGLTDYAKRKNIYVLRTQNGKQYRFPFNYEAVIRGEQMEQNIWVEPDDTIVVPH